MWRARIATLLLVAAACSESGIGSDAEPDSLGRAAEAATELLAQLPPLCATLRTEGYESRKAAVADASPTQRRLADDACPDDMRRLAEGRFAERAGAQVSGDHVDIGFARCAATRAGFEATIIITNRGPAPVGVYAAVRAAAGNESVGIGALAVAWHVAPGDSATREVSGTGNGDGCAVDFNVFASDPAIAGDGSTSAPNSPELASDDPAVWFPALVAAEQAWSAAADIDGPARTEDLRSTAYTDLVAALPNGSTDVPPAQVSVCSISPHPDSPGLAVVHARSGDTVVAGLVRRGHDDGWRWLGTTVTLGTGSCPDG